MTDFGARLSPEERDEFLALGITTRLACLDDDGWPYNVPVWHQWDGERFWIIGAEKARWVRWIERDARVCLCIDEPDSLTRVTCQGTARIVEGPVRDGQWPAIARQMAIRYLGEDALPGYEAASRGFARWLVAVDVTKMVTWRGAGRSEGSPVLDAPETGNG